MRRSIVKLLKSKGWDDEDIKAVEGRLYLHWEANTRQVTPSRGQPKGGDRNSGALRHDACRVLKVDLGSEDGAEDEMVVAIKRVIFLNGGANRQYVEVAEGGFNMWATQGGVPFSFCYTDQSGRRGQLLIAHKQCHVLTSTVLKLSEDIRLKAHRRLGKALYAVDGAKEGVILQVGHLEKRMFIIVNSKEGAAEIAAFLSEHTASFREIIGSTRTAWKPEGDSQVNTRHPPRDAAPIKITIARLQAEWDAPPPLPAPNPEGSQTQLQIRAQRRKEQQK
jgi:hypothetical protein